MAERKIADSHIHTRFADLERTKKMLDDIFSVGVTDTCILSLPYRGAADNLYSLYVKEKYKKINMRAFCGFHVTDRYASVDPKKQIETVLDLGADGVKLMFSPDLQRYYGKGLDDPYYDEMFSLLEERNTPVNIHLADPETFWENGKQYDDPTFPKKEEMYAQTFRMLDKHPKLRVCFAHFMFLSDFPDEAVRVMEKYPNVMFDLTPGVEMYPNFKKRIDFWKEFFKKYSKRIMFGTDCNTIKSINKDLEKSVYKFLTAEGDYTDSFYGTEYALTGINLSENELENICYNNFIRFVGESKKPLNVEFFKQCCQKIIDDLDNQPIDEFYIRGSEFITHLKEDPYQKIAYNFCKMALKNI